VSAPPCLKFSRSRLSSALRSRPVRDKLTTSLATILWLCILLVVYTYAVYPPLIWLCARLFGGRRQAPQPECAAAPSITLLVAAHNEAGVIAARLENALTVDYPRDKFAIVVASDGSSDATTSIVRSYADRGVRLLDYQPNRGKAATLNAALAEISGDLVLLSDANTHIDSQAPRLLARWFADPRVGAVCGRLILTDPRTGRNVDSLYWKYETFLKKAEGRLGALLGANGAVYAIRRELFTPIPSDTIVDDFVIPLLARLRTGCGIVYDAQAVAHEESPADLGSEFGRRSRIGAGGFQSIVLLWRLLDPRQGWTAFSFFSHKVLRWHCPFFLIVALAANLLLLNVPAYRGLLAAQVAFYGVSLAGAFLPGAGLAAKLVRLTTMFTSMNLALLVGFWRWISGRQRGVWQRTAR
jgi:cellulose synthase/poly-beta-1,6-N-acetylglucosamine synthase-like glycosyltransferase